MSDRPLSPEDFARAADVSRETLAALAIYAAHLVKWQTALNLVSRASLDDLWRRHMLDSAQIVRHLPPDGQIADLGSGAGFPGLVISLLTGRPVGLIESDTRKCAFLREVARLTRAPVEIVNTRIDAYAEKNSVDIVVARALAPLATLCEMAVSMGAGTCVFLKGAKWREELTATQKDWKMETEIFDSQTAPDARVLRLRQLRRLPR